VSRKFLKITLDSCKAGLWGALVLGLLFAGECRPILSQEDGPRKPQEAKVEDGAEYRWLNKPVLDSRLLDSMEDLSPWTFRGEGDMTLSDAYKKDGQYSLKIRSTYNVARVDGSGEWEDLVATRNVWSAAVLQAKSEDDGLVCANVSGL